MLPVPPLSQSLPCTAIPAVGWRGWSRRATIGLDLRGGVSRALIGSLACVLWAAGTGVVLAEKADRNKPMVLEADKRGTVDAQKQNTVFTGNVVITQGTLQIRAERVEIQEGKEGFRTAVAFGTAQQPAFFKQKRDGVDENVEGTAERIEFDEKSDTLRLSGNPIVRRLRGPQLADEITGNLITWDNRTEVFTVDGGARTPANPSGRVRMLLSPRNEAPAPAVPASGPGKAPGAARSGPATK